MIGTERRFFIEKCAKLLQDVLAAIRTLSWAEGHAKQINDLADLAQNIPEFLTGCNDYVLTYLRAGQVNYARKHHPDIDPEQHRYVRLFDMDEAMFTEMCRGPWVWHEPVPAVS